MRRKPEIPAEIEEHRDEHWRREAARQIETAFDAERFIEQIGFTACLTDSLRPGPSLYVAVCGRRDAVMPRNVQKDTEASLTWELKDELVRRGKVYYAKLARGKTIFLAPRMIPYFHAIWGVRRSEEKRRLTRNAGAVLHVLRKEWEMSTADLRDESGVKDRKAFTRALDELQAAMIVVPSAVFYQPKFTYIWTLGIGRFPDRKPDVAIVLWLPKATPPCSRQGFINWPNAARRSTKVSSDQMHRREGCRRPRSLVRSGDALEYSLHA